MHLVVIIEQNEKYQGEQSWYYFLPLLLLEKPGLEDVVLGNLP